jgi:hypothetical protein
MSVEGFRKAVGASDGSNIIFATETFPLDHMTRAIRDSAAGILAALNARCGRLTAKRPRI